MNSDVLKDAGKQLQKLAFRIIRSILIELVVVAVLLAIALKLIAKSELLLILFLMGLVDAILLLSDMNRIVFTVKTLSHASYISTHSMDIFLVEAQGYRRSLLSHLERGHLHFKDQAVFSLDGKLYKTGIDKMLRDDRDSGLLVVFRDSLKPDVVFAAPAVYMKETVKALQKNV